MAEVLPDEVNLARARIRSKRLEKANRLDLLDPLSRMERAVMAYTPKVYPGRATLFVSSERVEKSHGDIDFGWRAVIAAHLKCTSSLATTRRSFTF